MTRYYFYSADLYYYDPAGNSPPARIGDYQGVYENDDDSTTPSQAFTNLMEELKKAVPAELGANGYYHVTQFNNVT
jgi:hypothetical protein